jgi:branched-chain amino acid transport system substrate-binding protein
MPNIVHMGVYLSILHYLKSVAAAGSKDAGQVMVEMKAMPTDDPLFGKVWSVRTAALSIRCI